MNLPFERIITRRSFLKKCGILTLGSTLIPRLVKCAEAPRPTAGFIKPHRARFFEKLNSDKVRCLLCPHQCVVAKGERGFCRVRENRGGEYYTLVHSNPCAVHIDPIEKKPLFHFHPGTGAFSIATAGCNFTCKNCQNWDISQAKPDDTINYDMAPEKIVDLAIAYNTKTIAYTYTEPTVFFEYMLETAKNAHRRGVLNVYHSNGYINQEPLSELIPYLDGANVDLKAHSNEFYKEITSGTLYPVLETLKTLKQNGVWLEITNLVIPTKNDSERAVQDLCVYIESELGADTPIHFSRFYPQYKLHNLPPTPIETLQRAAAIARACGIHYVYIGNVPGIPEENTYCPNCHKLLIERQGYSVDLVNLKDGTCLFCGTAIAGRWK